MSCNNPTIAISPLPHHPVGGKQNPTFVHSTQQPNQDGYPANRQISFSGASMIGYPAAKGQVQGRHQTGFEPGITQVLKQGSHLLGCAVPDSTHSLEALSSSHATSQMTHLDRVNTNDLRFQKLSTLAFCMLSTPNLGTQSPHDSKISSKFCESRPQPFHPTRNHFTQPL